jgi:hypothetical protein
MFQQRKSRWGAVLAVLVALAGTMGCGGGGDGDTGGANPNMTNITRSTESTFSESARILAAREAAANGATWLNADSARTFDSEMAVIRRTFPQVNDIAARPDYDLRTVVVAVRAGTSWESNWNRGNATTGEAALDGLLNEFAPEAIQLLGSPVETMPAYYTLRFGQSLNMVKLAERLNAASPNIIAADPNYIAGDGNNITTANGAGDGRRRYVFSRGSGDCPAGCINRYSYEFAVAPGAATATLIKESDGQTE